MYKNYCYFFFFIKHILITDIIKFNNPIAKKIIPQTKGPVCLALIINIILPKIIIKEKN